MLAADIAFNSNKSGSLGLRGLSAFSIAWASAALLWKWWNRNNQYSREKQVKISRDTNHNSVWCSCCCALINESDANWLSREGGTSICVPIDWKCFLEKRFRLKLCLTFNTWAEFSAILRRQSTHSWRARPLAARNFNVSPEAQLTVNVRESSSLGQITAPAKYSYKSVMIVQINFIN